MIDDRTPSSGFLSRWSRVKAEARSTRTSAPTPLGPDVSPPALAPVDAPSPSHGPSPSAANPADGAKAAEPAPAPMLPATDGPVGSPPPTLDEAAALPAGSDVARFVARDVAPDVRNTALRRLFADPAFNVMDGLDVYIDDYGRPDPLPAAALRKMVAGVALNLLSDRPPDGPDVAGAPPAPSPTSVADVSRHEDADLRLQPDDADRPSGADPRPEPDPGRER